MRKLSTGEWRLFLLSDCIKYHRDVYDNTSLLRQEGKEAILKLDGNDSKELDYYISDEDAKKIRVLLRKEWRFTNKVTDNGRNNKTICEYCQKQHIRYKYWCHNAKTNIWLSLGSVCVGRIIHGEEKMDNPEFNKNFVQKMESFKSADSSLVDPKIKQEQAELIRKCVAFLNSKGIRLEEDSFLSGIRDHWYRGKLLSPGQIETLKNKCRKARNNIS